jgi:hypothetical protein
MCSGYLYQVCAQATVRAGTVGLTLKNGTETEGFKTKKNEGFKTTDNWLCRAATLRKRSNDPGPGPGPKR